MRVFGWAGTCLVQVEGGMAGWQLAMRGGVQVGWAGWWLGEVRSQWLRFSLVG